MQIKDLLKKLDSRIDDTFLLYLFKYSIYCRYDKKYLNEKNEIMAGEIRYIDGGDAQRGAPSNLGCMGSGCHTKYRRSRFTLKNVILYMESVQEDVCKCEKFRRREIEMDLRTDSDNELESILAWYLRFRLHSEMGLNINSVVHSVEEMKQMYRTVGM